MPLRGKKSMSASPQHKIMTQSLIKLHGLYAIKHTDSFIARDFSLVVTPSQKIYEGRTSKLELERNYDHPYHSGRYF